MAAAAGGSYAARILDPDPERSEVSDDVGSRSRPASLLVIAVAGLVAALSIVVGGALAGAAAPGGSGRLWSVPAVPVRPVMSLVPALGMFYGGLIVLVRCWLLLRRHQLTFGLTRLALAAVVVVWSIPFLVGPPLGSRDVYAYAAQGRLADRGYDVYVDGPASLGPDDPVLAAVDPLYHDAPVLYGPVFVAVSATISRWTGDGLVQAVLVYRLMAVLGLVIAAIAVNDLARGLGRDPIDALVLAFANPLVLLHLVSGAHNEAIMLAFLVSGVAIGRRARWRFVGVALCAMAAAIKLPAILAVAFIGWPWVVEAERRSVALARIAAVAAEAFVVIALAGRLTGWGWGWVDAITATKPVDAYLSLTRVLGGGVAWLTGYDAVDVVAVARLGGLIVAVSSTLILLIRGYRSWPLALAWSLLIWALLHPTTQPWYLTWGIMLLAATSSGERNRSFVAGCAVAAFVVLPIGPQLGLLLLADTGVGSLALGLVVLAALTFSPRRPESGRRRASLDPSLVSVVVPTRHEGPNVEPLVQGIGAAVDGAGGRGASGTARSVEVVFVDDSDDETPAVIDAVASSPAEGSLGGNGVDVRLMHRRPGQRWGGLAGAVTEGLDIVRGSVVVVMDGDLQHPPEALGSLLAALDDGADVAVASRRLPASRQDRRFGPGRRVVSWVATGLAWTLFPRRLGRCSDPLSGFFAFRLSAIDLDRLHPDGFKVLAEVLATHPELRVADVPFEFNGRLGGASKAGLDEASRYLGHLIDLRIRTSWAWGGAPVPQRAFRSA